MVGGDIETAHPFCRPPVYDEVRSVVVRERPAFDVMCGLDELEAATVVVTEADLDDHLRPGEKFRRS